MPLCFPYRRNACLLACAILVDCVGCLYLLFVRFVERSLGLEGVSWFSRSRLGVGLSGTVLAPDGESENSNTRKLKTCGAS